MSKNKEKKKEILENLEESNRSKYGEKEFDQISQNFRISKDRGIVWIVENIKRYIDRFSRPGSSKAGNIVDLYKARDYMNRLIEEEEKNLESIKPNEIIEDVNHLSKK